MPDQIIARPGFRDVNVRYVDMADTSFAEKVVVVNADGTPIAGGGGGGGMTDAQFAAHLPLSTNPTDRAARLVGVVYGSQGQQVKQTATNFNLATELHVGATAIDPRSIRALTAADVVTANAGTGVFDVTPASPAANDYLPVRLTDGTSFYVASGGAGGGMTDAEFTAHLPLAIAEPVSVDDNGGSLTVDGTFFQATQPVSLAAAVDVSDRAGRALGVVATVTNLAQQGGVAISLNTGVRDAGTQRVTIATNDVVPVTGTFFQATQPVSIAAAVDVSDRVGRALGVVASITAAVDVSDRAARLVGVVYGSQAQQLKQTATNFNAQVEVAVGGTLIDPRSIRTLTSSDVVDVFDKAAREVGRVRIWDGTDEATVIPVRTQPAATEKALMVSEIPTRIATYSTTTIAVAPAITIGVKELLALWHVVGSTKDKYIVEISVSAMVTTASTAGRTAVRVSTITTAPTGGTEEGKVDVSGAGASDMTNTMRVKTGGGAIGTTFIRRVVWGATQAVNSRISEALFQASNPGNGIILRAGVAAGISIDVEREVAHTALVDQWYATVRWLEV